MVQKVVLFIILLLSSHSISAQRNGQVLSAWKSLYNRDQVKPSERTEESVNANLRDACNLILNYGYPDFEDYKVQNTPILTLVHCTMPSYQLAAYPILYQGYLNGFIDTLHMANYVTRAVHNDLFHRSSIKFSDSKEAAQFVTRFYDLVVSYSTPAGDTFNHCEECYALLLADFTLPLDSLVKKGTFIGLFEIDTDPFYWRMKRQKPHKVRLYQFEGALYYLTERSSIGFKMRQYLHEASSEQEWYQYPPYITSESLAIKTGERGEDILVVKVGSSIYEYPRVYNH